MKGARKLSRPALTALFGTLLFYSTACHSHWVATTIVNQGPVVRLLELDYPSASFGVDTLPSGSEYQYRFKILGSGPLTLQFQDAGGKSYSITGPEVREGEEGSMTVTIGAHHQVSWAPGLTPSR